MKIDINKFLKNYGIKLNKFQIDEFECEPLFFIDGISFNINNMLIQNMNSTIFASNEEEKSDSRTEILLEEDGIFKSESEIFGTSIAGTRMKFLKNLYNDLTNLNNLKEYIEDFNNSSDSFYEEELYLVAGLKTGIISNSLNDKEVEELLENIRENIKKRCDFPIDIKKRIKNMKENNIPIETIINKFNKEGIPLTYSKSENIDSLFSNFSDNIKTGDLTILLNDDDPYIFIRNSYVHFLSDIDHLIKNQNNFNKIPRGVYTKEKIHTLTENNCENSFIKDLPYGPVDIIVLKDEGITVYCNDIFLLDVKMIVIDTKESREVIKFLNIKNQVCAVANLDDIYIFNITPINWNP